MGIEFRTAKRSELKEVTQLMYDSGVSLYDYLHKTSRNDALDFIEYEYEKETGFCSSQNVIVAVSDGKVLASSLGFDALQHKKMSGETIKNVLSFHKLRSLKVLMRLKSYAKTRNPPKEGDYYLSNVCVNPNYRSKGVGVLLMKHQISEAKKNGYQKFCGDVLISNTRALGFYYALGFKALYESKLEIDGISYSAKRLSLDLDKYH